MKKWLTYISVGIAAVALPALMLFFSPWATAQDERGECQKRCTDQYQECRRAANANQATCKQTFDACRDACRAGNANGNTNGNMNGNTNGNTNTEGNTNTGENDNTGGNMNAGGNTNTDGNTNTGGNTNQPGVRRGRLEGTPRGPVNKNANTSPTP